MARSRRVGVLVALGLLVTLALLGVTTYYGSRFHL